jgi:drug/metabolite transporter (DMT)-like permease
MSRKEWAGVLAACVSSALGGTAVVATRAVVGQIDPLALAALRHLIGAACLLPLALSRGRARPARADWPAVAGLGLLFFGLFPYLFTLSLSMTTAARGSLALSTLPLVTLGVAAFLGAERLTGGKLAGVLVALTGVALALSGRMAGVPDGAWRGDLVMVGAALVGAVYNVRSRPCLARYPAVVFTAWAMAAGAAAPPLVVVVEQTAGRDRRAVVFVETPAGRQRRQIAAEDLVRRTRKLWAYPVVVLAWPFAVAFDVTLGAAIVAGAAAFESRAEHDRSEAAAAADQDGSGLCGRCQQEREDRAILK